MKIAHVAPSFYPARVYGGPTETVYRLCQATAAAGCVVRVLTTDANGPSQVLDVRTNRETWRDDRFSVQYCKRQCPESISIPLLRELDSYLEWADVVHLEAVYSFPTLPVLWMAGRKNKPVVWSSRGALARWSGARRTGLKSLYDRLCRGVMGKRLFFHFTSEAEREASLKRFPGLDGVVIPNGVQSPECVKHVERNGKFRLLYLGRLDPIKGIENLLQACHLLAESIPNSLEVTIAGEGNSAYTAHLQALIQDLGLSDGVRMIGPVHGNSKEDAFSRADAVIVPSHLENFCIVVAEALAREVPVIVSRGAPWPGLEKAGCGLWIDNDPSSLRHGIEQMMTMPLSEMGKKGRQWMQKDFSWDSVAARMINVYQKTLEDKK